MHFMRENLFRHFAATNNFHNILYSTRFYNNLLKLSINIYSISITLQHTFEFSINISLSDSFRCFGHSGIFDSEMSFASWWVEYSTGFSLLKASVRQFQWEKTNIRECIMERNWLKSIHQTTHHMPKAVHIVGASAKCWQTCRSESRSRGTAVTPFSLRNNYREKAQNIWFLWNLNYSSMIFLFDCQDTFYWEKKKISNIFQKVKWRILTLSSKLSSFSA